MNSSRFDPFSFWVGAAVASGFWFLLKMARPLLDSFRDKWQKRRKASSARGSRGVEDNHRHAVLKRAQGMHLAASLFSLDEIVIQPSLLAPPQQIKPGSDVASTDQTNLVIPYLPQDPSFAAFYQTETLTIHEVLSSEVHLAILGKAGTGKSVALAYIASLTAKRDEKMGALQESIPFLLHVADLNLPDSKKDDILEPINEFFSKDASRYDASRLPKFIELSFSTGRALFLLDGLDEIPREETKKVVSYLESLLKSYPEIRIITTGSIEYLDRLAQIDFVPLTLKGWGRLEQREFLDKWGDLWGNFVALEAWVQAGPEKVDATLLNA